MNYSIYRFTLEMHSAQSQISVPVMLGDTSRIFRIKLSDGGKPYLLENGCLAKISIKRPTGTHLEEFCTIENNTTIVYDFMQNENTAAVEGIHECDITVYGIDGGEITSPRFTMVVNERATSTDDFEISDENKYLIETIEKTEAARIKSEENRIAAETVRAASEEERQTSFNNTMEKINNALKVTFSDDSNGNVSVSMIGLHLVDKGEGNIVMEVHE